MQLVFKLRQVHCPKQRNQLNGIIRPIVLVLRLQIVPTFQNLLAGSELLLAMICLRIDGLGRLSSFLRQPVGYNTVYFFLRERPAAARIPILILRVGVGGLLLGVLVHSFFAHSLPPFYAQSGLI